jgi:asparagine synthase (glutamine-hydrolysing)
MISASPLVAPHRYRMSSGVRWHANLAAVLSSARTLTVDNASLLSIVSLGYTFGNKTLFREIGRLPWMTRVEGDGSVTTGTMPPHGFRYGSPDVIARRLYEALLDEARTLIQGRREVVLLLSGGLDSRIVALVVSELLRRGDIDCRVRCVTWGVPECRDVVYGCATARLLGLDWEHLNLGAEHLWENIGATAKHLGASIFPTHLHRMLWCRTLPPDTLVLAGSYGDSIGRAEFSGLHLLEVGKLTAHDDFGLIEPRSAARAEQDLAAELAAFHAGKDQLPDHVLREHEMLGIYMRNGLSDAMGLIAGHCHFGQLFTDPRVYGFMWSLHPSFRTNAPYMHLLQTYGGVLAALPWARTNRAVQGPTRGAQRGLKKDFHNYRAWVSTCLASKLRHTVDPDWFADLGGFDPAAIRALREEVLQSPRGLLRPAELLTWLASFRLCVDGLRRSETRITLEPPPAPSGHRAPKARHTPAPMRLLRHLCERSPVLEASLKHVRKGIRRSRRALLMRRLIELYPPEPLPPPG